jgi:hypothetical protein
MIRKINKIQMPRHWLAWLSIVAMLAALVLTVSPASAAGSNLALNKPAKVSSIEAAGFEAAKAVDGNTSTRWASVEPATSAQWIYVDLGTTTAISQVILRWEAAYAKSYTIQTSNNASTWTTIYTTTTGDGATDDLTVSGSGRYVRVYMTKRGTAYGYSLWEFEIYGTGGATATNTAIGPTATRTNTPVAPTATRTNTPIIPTATRTNTPFVPTATRTNTPVPVAQEFFDDFAYTGPSDSNLTNFGWSVRADTGCPGPGTDCNLANYQASNITFVDGPVNKVLRLKASISGGQAYQAELDYENEKMLEGTYAARVWFADAPASGSDGDYIVEANFWSMSDWSATTGKTSYSELDFEYLPNGGWGGSGANMWNTTWEQDDPANNTETVTPGSFAGWHTLLIVVSGGQVKYYDGSTLLATHGGIFYPESNMSMIPQLWFDTINTSGSSWYVDDDWVYYARNTVLTSSQVEANVASLRTGGIVRKNTLP